MAEVHRGVSNLYTLWKEPGHEMVVYRVGAEQALQAMGINNRDYYILEKALRGKIPGWTAGKEKCADIKAAAYENTDPPPIYMAQTGGRGQQRMCGECPKWESGHDRDSMMRKWGICKKTKQTHERCDWCNIKKDEGGKENEEGRERESGTEGR